MRIVRAALAALLFASPAAAQVSVEVSPLRVEMDAGPGSTATQAVTLKNYSKQAIRVRATLTDWDLSRDGTPQFDGVEAGPYSATSWVRLAPPEQVIEADAEAAVRFSLAIPQGLEPGGYRTSILFEFSPPADDPLSKSRAVSFKGRVGTLIYLNVGRVAGAAELTNVEIRNTPVETQIVAILKNTSRRSMRTKGALVVVDAAGQTVKTVGMPDVPVLPESEREVAIPVAGGEAGTLPDGTYRIELRIDVGLPALIVGETQLKVGG